MKKFMMILLLPLTLILTLGYAGLAIGGPPVIVFDDINNTHNPIFGPLLPPTWQSDDNSDFSDDNLNNGSSCNQGRGNDSEGCDPGNSNYNQDSNDEMDVDGNR